MEGTIKRLMRDRGFGFIHAQDGQEVFFHRSSLKQLDFDRLREGLNVEFEMQPGDRGLRAANVRVSWTELTLNK
jgi:cold shock protein